MEKGVNTDAANANAANCWQKRRQGGWVQKLAFNKCLKQADINVPIWDISRLNSGSSVVIKNWGTVIERTHTMAVGWFLQQTNKQTNKEVMEVLYAVIDIFFVLQDWVLGWIILALFAEYDCI